jgi:RNA polymerase sigma-70 factor, ECF subfamily
VDDETLYQQVRSKNEAALGTLVERYHSPIYKFLVRNTGDTALADDMVQETFIRLLTHKGPAPDHFKAWIYTIAANVARDHFRSAAYRYEHMTDFNESEEYLSRTPADTDSSEVEAALASLPPEQREVVILRFYHDLKLDEIAEITHAPLGTVKSRLFHALKGLKGFLAVMEVVEHDGP